MFMEYGVAIALVGVTTLIYADYIKITSNSCQRFGLGDSVRTSDRWNSNGLH